MISIEEIKNVKFINLENKDLTNADLAGLSEAVNCKRSISKTTKTSQISVS